MNKKLIINGSFGIATLSISDENLAKAALAAYNNSSFKLTLMQDAKTSESVKQKEPNGFNEPE
ncbi:hypothetical protein AB7W84_19555 [Providencia rettgeri]